MGERRSNISPSDLTFSWDGCHRCLWLYYNHQVKAPMFMPTVAELADLQETYFKNKTTADMHPDMPAGKIVDHGGWVQSVPIQVDGVDSHLAIRGKYDLLLEFPDGTYGIIDCKMQARASDKSSFYSPQLEAYAFALENPAKGEPKKISVLGIYSWSLNQAWGNVQHGFGYRVNSAWYPVERNPIALQKRLVDFVTVVNGAMPESKPSCDQCRYISERDSIVRTN
jgi:hypothetical protein